MVLLGETSVVYIVEVRNIRVLVKLALNTPPSKLDPVEARQRASPEHSSVHIRRWSYLHEACNIASAHPH